MMPLPTCGVIGPGRLGKTLALALHHRGCLRWVKGRSQHHSRWAAQHGLRYASRWEELEPVEVVWLTVPDQSIARLIRESVPQCSQWSLPCSLVHCAGSLGIAPFRELLPEGLELAAAHPCQTFPEPADPSRLRCIGWLVESPWLQTQQRLTRLIRALEGIPVIVSFMDPHRRALYHAAAVLASNALTALLSFAHRLARSAGVPEALFLQPLAHSSMANFFSAFGPPPLTGPIVRGDWETLRRHLRELPAPEAELYRHLLAAIGMLAHLEGILDEQRYGELRAVLTPDT